MKSEGSDRRTNYVNSLTGSSSSHPLNPSDGGGGLSSLDGQNNAAHVNGNSRVNQNTKTSSQLGKTRDGIVSVPQPLSKSADRRFSGKKRIIIVVAVFAMVAVSVLLVNSKQNRQAKTNKYKYNVCSESEVNRAIEKYSKNDSGDLTNMVIDLEKSDAFNYDAKCLYIGILEAKLRNSKYLILNYTDFYAKADDRTATDKLISVYGGDSVDDIKKFADSLESSLRKQGDVLKKSSEVNDLPPEMGNDDQ